MFMGFGLVLTGGAMAAIAYALAWPSKNNDDSFSPNRDGKSPLDIARERYARGEIDKEEFVQIRQDLRD